METDPWMQRATRHYPAGGVRHGITAADLFAYGNVTERFLDLRCMPVAMLTGGCLGGGLSWGDWLLSAETMRAEERTPSAHNTLQWPWVKALQRADQTTWVHGPSNMAANELLAALREKADQRVRLLTLWRRHAHRCSSLHKRQRRSFSCPSCCDLGACYRHPVKRR